MSTNTGLLTRAIAALALSAAVVAVIAILSSGDSGDPAGSANERAGARTTNGNEQARGSGERRRRPARYMVESGDTLLGISAKTGVSLSRLQELNPGIDPQVLVTGQRLRLR